MSPYTHYSTWLNGTKRSDPALWALTQPAPGKTVPPCMSQVTAEMLAFSSLGVLQCCACGSPVVHRGSFYTPLEVRAMQGGISKEEISSILSALD